MEALADGTQWRFGYDLSRETGIASGTLYPLLGRLADRGYLVSRWEQTRAGRPPRHLYRLTVEGRRYIAAEGASASDSAHATPVAQGS